MRLVGLLVATLVLGLIMTAWLKRYGEIVPAVTQPDGVVNQEVGKMEERVSEYEEKMRQQEEEIMNQMQGIR